MLRCCTLMYKLVKCMLSIGSWFSPHNGASLIVHKLSTSSDVLAVTLHVSLLEVSSKSVHVLKWTRLLITSKNPLFQQRSTKLHILGYQLSRKKGTFSSIFCIMVGTNGLCLFRYDTITWFYSPVKSLILIKTVDRLKEHIILTFIHWSEKQLKLSSHLIIG